MRRIALALALAACACHRAERREPRDTIARSDENARLLVDVQARFAPEGAARLGVEGVDNRISDLSSGHRDRQRAALREALAELKRRAAAERDEQVALDLELLIKAADRQIRGSELSQRLEVPYLNAARLVFGSVRSLLDPQVAASRRPAAVARIRKYAGLEPGTQPLVDLIIAESRDGLEKGLLPPSRLEIEEDLRTASFVIDGTEKLLREYQLDVSAFAELKAQLDRYLRYQREELLPKARTDFKLPPELYAFRLEQYGVDLPPRELAARAHAAFAQLQSEMQPIAAKIAAERKLPSADYRDVIRALKKEQIPDDQVLSHYKERLAEIEGIIRDQKLVSLPARPARIRLGTPAENAQNPAPHMTPPRLLGNSGEQGEFVLPLSIPGTKELKYDDFNYRAASWTLTAHEARPGHELQFDTMVERGISIARAVYAQNSANSEGWGLYAEAITLPYMPPEGQLVSLQLRLQRAARAFVDPELQEGKWTPESALEYLQREVVLSPAFAKQEVDRFTFRAPGQATSYFYGYLRLLELRAAAEAKLGARFSPLRFHDTILAQGLLPPDLMKRAVLEAL